MSLRGGQKDPKSDPPGSRKRSQKLHMYGSFCYYNDIYIEDEKLAYEYPRLFRKKLKSLHANNAEKVSIHGNCQTF